MVTKLTDEERVWRYNYILRVSIGQIPKRNKWDNNLVSRIEEFWPHFRAGDSKIARKVFNHTTGLVELVWEQINKNTDYGWQYLEIDETIREKMLSNPLPWPPTDNSLPPSVYVNIKEKLRFIKMCPHWMPWKVKLIKDDGTWYMSIPQFEAYSRHQKKESEQAQLDSLQSEKVFSELEEMLRILVENNDPGPNFQIFESKKMAKIQQVFYQGLDTFLFIVEKTTGEKDSVITEKKEAWRIWNKLYKYILDNNYEIRNDISLT